jgi:hypothetical protein
MALAQRVLVGICKQNFNALLWPRLFVACDTLHCCAPHLLAPKLVDASTAHEPLAPLCVAWLCRASWSNCNCNMCVLLPRALLQSPVSTLVLMHTASMALLTTSSSISSTQVPATSTRGRSSGSNGPAGFLQAAVAAGAPLILRSSCGTGVNLRGVPCGTTAKAKSGRHWLLWGET